VQSVRRLEYVRRGELRWAEAPDARVQDASDAVVRPIASTTCDLGASHVDYVDRSARRRGQAEALGASAHEAVPTRQEYEIVVDASAERAALAEGLRHAAPGGRCHSVGIYFGEPTPLPLDHMYMQGVTLTTGRPDVLGDIPAVLDLVADGTVDPRSVFSERVAWEDAPAALAELPRKPLVVRQRR
jgi:threonine dehydrogenase-like Zn-dependent dehydrogenase